MKFLHALSMLLAVLFLGACTPERPEPVAAAPAVTPADVIYAGANIITMDDSKPEAVAVRGEKIIATGT